MAPSLSWQPDTSASTIAFPPKTLVYLSHLRLAPPLRSPSHLFVSLTPICSSMDSTESSPLNSFKSKKILRSSSKPSSSLLDQNPRPHPDPNPWSSKTPEKPIIPPRRTRNRGAALSLKEVRQAAKNLQESARPHPKSRPDPLMTSAKERIPLWPESSPAKSKKPDTSFKLPEK